MLNKKAQLGNLIPTVPIMILIFFLMAIFVFLSAAASKVYGGENENAYYYGAVSQEDLMAKKVSLAGDTLPNTLLDILVAFENKKIDEVKLYEYVDSLADGSHDLVIAFGPSSKPFSQLGMAGFYSRVLIQKQFVPTVTIRTGQDFLNELFYRHYLRETEFKILVNNSDGSNSLVEKRIYVNYCYGVCTWEVASK